MTRKLGEGAQRAKGRQMGHTTRLGPMDEACSSSSFRSRLRGEKRGSGGRSDEHSQGARAGQGKVTRAGTHAGRSKANAGQTCACNIDMAQRQQTQDRRAHATSIRRNGRCRRTETNRTGARQKARYAKNSVPDSAPADAMRVYMAQLGTITR
jgi:hypothetical protein